MIISHKYKFIFFAVPKTATHAVRFALRPMLGVTDEEQVGLYVQKSLSYPAFQQITHGHISTVQAKAVLSDEVWSTYFKFAFIRNPFDRFVSFCFYLNRKNRSFGKNTTLKMIEIIENTENKNKILFRPQHELICDVEGKTMLDFVGRFESFQKDFELVCKKINIPTPKLSHFNASQHEHYARYYNEALIKQVTDFYKRDFDLFNYKELPF